MAEEDVEATNEKTTLVIVTFGKKFGSVDRSNYDKVYNCTTIPNPAAKRKGVTGLSKRFRQEVLKNEIAAAIVQQATTEILQSCQQNGAQRKYGFFCEHGKHRSVSVAEAVADALRRPSFVVELEHRDVLFKPKTHKKRRNHLRPEENDY